MMSIITLHVMRYSFCNERMLVQILTGVNLKHKPSIIIDKIQTFKDLWNHTIKELIWYKQGGVDRDWPQMIRKPPSDGRTSFWMWTLVCSGVLWLSRCLDNVGWTTWAGRRHLYRSEVHSVQAWVEKNKTFQNGFKWSILGHMNELNFVFLN